MAFREKEDSKSEKTEEPKEYGDEIRLADILQKQIMEHTNHYLHGKKPAIYRETYINPKIHKGKQWPTRQQPHGSTIAPQQGKGRRFQSSTTPRNENVHMSPENKLNPYDNSNQGIYQGIRSKPERF